MHAADRLRSDDRRIHCFLALVALLATSTRARLLNRLACKYTKRDGLSVPRGDLRKACRDGLADVLIMGRLASQHAAKAHDRVNVRTRCERVRKRDQLERARSVDKHQVRFITLGSSKGVKGPVAQPPGDAFVVAARHDADPQSAGVRGQWNNRVHRTGMVVGSVR